MKQRQVAELGYPQQMPVRYNPDALHEYDEAYTTEEIIEGLQELQSSRARHLLYCHTDLTIPPEERKQALYDFCVVSMAEDLMTPGKGIHNPLNSPRWLALAHSRMAEFIMADIDNRYVLTETKLFCGDEDREYLHNLANSISASIIPLEPHDDRIFAIGVLTEQIRPWVLPAVRADELTLT
jgi:hypothetical protein